MIPFHRLLIGTGIVFAAGFALWAFVRYRQEPSALMLILTIAFTAAAVALAYYLRHLRRFLGR
jgi:hypothetical protein